MAFFIIGTLIVIFFVVPFLLFRNQRMQSQIGPAELFKGAPNIVGGFSKS